MKKVLILTADGFEDMEVFVPRYRLLEEGWQVTIAAPATETISGKHGYRIKPDAQIDGLDATDHDLLILPGGSKDAAPKVVSKISNAQKIARDFFSQNKTVAAICHGPYTLIEADLIKNRQLTSYPKDNLPEEIRQAGGIWLDREVVVDNNLISSRSPKDLPAFLREIIKAFAKNQ